MKKLMTMVMALVLAIGMMIPMFASADQKTQDIMWVNCADGKTLNVRETPSTKAKVLYRVESGEKIDLLARPWRFNEILRSIPGISQKVLTDNLRALEKDGIIIRTVYPEVPSRVEYSLSELGESIRPIIRDMEAWGKNYQQLVKSAE